MNHDSNGGMGESVKFTDGQKEQLVVYAIVEIVIWLTILLLAVYNIIFYISKIENNKFMTKLFYFLVCL